MISLDKIKKELLIRASRSSGPGGQNVNKVATKVTIFWDLQNSAECADKEKELIWKEALRVGYATHDGEIVIHEQGSRSQLRNKEIAIEKLQKLIAKALVPKKRRIKTKIPKRSKDKRISEKKKRGERLRQRQRGGE